MGKPFPYGIEGSFAKKLYYAVAPFRFFDKKCRLLFGDSAEILF